MAREAPVLEKETEEFLSKQGLKRKSESDRVDHKVEFNILGTIYYGV